MGERSVRAWLAAAAGLALLSHCAPKPEARPGDAGAAPGAPGAAPNWSSARKVGIGTSYEAYRDGAFSDAAATGRVSKVWFSLTQDRVTEVMWGLIHEAQLRELRFLAAGPEGLVALRAQPVGWVYEDAAGRPLAPVYRLLLKSADAGVVVAADVWTAPDHQALVISVQAGVTSPQTRLYAFIDPALANTGTGDRAQLLDGGAVHAWEGAAHLVMKAERAGRASVGFVGESDGLSDLGDGELNTVYASTGEVAGNVAGLVELPLDTSGGYLGAIVVGFGDSREAAEGEADAVLRGDYLAGRDTYVRQWQGYLDTLGELPSLAGQAADGGRLAYASALVLKVMEDKTYAGALIASLSNPWGEAASAAEYRTGYKGVWPRDLFQVASAFLAMGDAETALAALRYLPRVQVSAATPGNRGATGWFLQKAHVDGTPEWVGVQLDQTAMPVMLAGKLWRAGLIGPAELAQRYDAMIRPAADFLVSGGQPDLDWNRDYAVVPPATQQDRWEEQSGYSPSTTAAVIAGLVSAADIATALGRDADAARYLVAADAYEADIEATMFTTEGALPGSDGRYFLRITQNDNPDDHAPIDERNGLPAIAEDLVIDGGFLELVRYGVRAADAPSIRDSLPELFDQTLPEDLRVRHDVGVRVGLRRYGHDGYGEDQIASTGYAETGKSTPGQRGRIWPLLSGEVAHYELSALAGPSGMIDAETRDVLRETYATTMEAFANGGLMLPEQVWDGVGYNPFGYETGEGTDSATPLAWSHAEYIRLLRSLRDGQVWDRIGTVAQRYAD